MEPIPTKLQCWELHAKQDLRRAQRAPEFVASLGPNDVVVAPRKTGLCGSDNHWYAEGRVMDLVLLKPRVLGHEFAGIVTEVGAEVTTLKVGDPVAVEPAITCRVCEYCKSGRYNQCTTTLFPGFPRYDGSLRSFVNLPADLCYKLPAGVKLEHGALLEPLAVAVHAIANVAQMKPNSNVLVTGSGPVGLLAIASVLALGARKVVAMDVLQERLDFAKQVGATATFMSPKLLEGEDTAAYSRRVAAEVEVATGISARGEEKIDLVLECSGAESCCQIGAYLVKPSGTFVAVGMGKQVVGFPFDQLIKKELLVRGSFRYGPGAYTLALDLIAQGKINLDTMVSHRFAFKDAPDAFEAVMNGKGKDGRTTIKVIIDGPLDTE